MMNQPSDFTTDKAVYGYLPLMHELAERIELVAAVCEGRNAAFAKACAREFAYLQFTSSGKSVTAPLAEFLSSKRLPYAVTH